MIIGIDGNEANVKEKVGVSVYIFNLLVYFKKKAKDSLHFRIFLKNKPSSDLPSANEYFKYEVVAGNFLWSQIMLPARLYFKKNIDVLFSPAHYAPRFCPVPLVVTIHDLSYFYYPDEFLKKDLYQLKNWTKYSVIKAKKIIAVSQTTKKDLIKFYQTPEEKIEVIYNGGPLRHSEPERSEGEESLQKNKIIKNKYILYVGTLQPRKNLITLIDAFFKFDKIHPEFKLVIAGKKGWLYEEIFNHVKKLNLEKRVKFAGYVSDKQLETLYERAFCFVLPSLYEGFGIPILQAMSHDTPVISSFTSSLPEIGADACLYFDPTSVDDLVDKLIELKENENLRDNLIKRGKERVKLFSWDKSAEETLKIIKSSFEH